MGEIIPFRPRQQKNEFVTQGALAVSPQVTDLEYDAVEALERNKEFYQALGQIPQNRRLGNYEIGIERAKFERFRRTILNDNALPVEVREEALVGFKKESVQQITTALSERYHAEKSTFHYATKNGKLYSSLSPEEPMEDVLERGLITLKKTQSKEQGREQAEFDGWRDMQKIVINKKIPVGTKIIQMSPPGVIPDTAYPRHFVDGWKIMENENGERYAEVTRFTTSLDHDGYIAAAKKMDPHFMDAFEENNKNKPVEEQMTIDEYLIGKYKLFHPGWGIEELYEGYFEQDYEAILKQAFQNLIEVCLPIVLHEVDILCADTFQPVALAEGYNAILARGDTYIDERERRGTVRENNISPERLRAVAVLPLSEQVLFWSKQDIRRVTGAGCGNSEPFKIRYGFDSLEEASDNSIMKTGLNKKVIKADCPDCGEEHTRAENEWIYRCKKCDSRTISCGREEPIAA